MMISTWVSVTAMLVALMNGVRTEDNTQPCAKVHTSRSVVPLGSPVTATCVIRDDCPLVIGQAVHIEWRLGDRLIPSSPAVNESDRVSRAVVASFNHTRAVLTCCIQASNQVVAGVEIRAGYSPESPRNLSCQTNLTSPITLTCSWTPGQHDTHLPTNYSLHTEIWDSSKNHTYEPPSGVHHYTIPRSDFILFSEMKIYVKAKNLLGEATSAPVVLEPVSAAKFDPPKIRAIQVVPKRLGCLRLSWSLSQHQVWMRNYLNLEVRLKTADSSSWSEKTILLDQIKPSKPVVQCHLLHGTVYLAQIRVRYQQSPWSEWSSSHSGLTLESAPTGRLDTWIKVSRDNTPTQLNIQLFWKASKQFRANSQNVSYVIFLHKQPNKKSKLCSTSDNYCTFTVSKRARKVYLSAVNRAGKSLPTDVRIYQPKVAQSAVKDVKAVPHDSRSLLVQWTSLVSSDLTGYVVEWRPLLKADLSHIHFETVAKNQSSFIITGNFEPYKPYGISVYPRFEDGIGFPQTVNAYLKQKAPDIVPKIKIKNTWGSQVEFSWDEIPLNQMNGIIQGYKVFYWNGKNPVKVVSVGPEERKLILENLNTMTVYEAIMMVTTCGGSLNGTIIHFQVQPFDAVTVGMIVIASGVGLAVFIIFTFMTCFSKKKRLKGHLWPLVPDPANSSVKRWTSESLQYAHPSWNNEEPNPKCLSHLSLLDLTTKPIKGMDDLWLNRTEDTSDLAKAICGSPFIPGYNGSNSNSVPYATVIFSAPFNNPPPMERPVYLRSESTQPLLEMEESFSPKSYQNMVTDGMPVEQCFFGPDHDCIPEKGLDPADLWHDFPFLQALAMKESEDYFEDY
ncbi:granulocyte colony-stimulating factor receptor-like isoform 1-T4 [Menidia menidia]